MCCCAYSNQLHETKPLHHACCVIPVSVRLYGPVVEKTFCFYGSFKLLDELLLGDVLAGTLKRPLPHNNLLLTDFSAHKWH